ncbi:hypothetical protein LXL04_009865 [Taraxacum kok-saghyz]
MTNVSHLTGEDYEATMKITMKMKNELKLRKMEGTISLCQYDDNKENIPPSFSISKTTDNKLNAKTTLKKKKKTNKYKNNCRIPLNDITNLIVDSFVQSPSTSFLSPRLQSRSICRPTTGNRVLVNEACCKSLRFSFR